MMNATEHNADALATLRYAVTMKTREATEMLLVEASAALSRAVPGKGWVRMRGEIGYRPRITALPLLNIAPLPWMSV
jgi:hypothetical protein